MLLNLEEDHLDRHGTFERYREAKLRVFARQGDDDVAVVPPGSGSWTSAAARGACASAAARGPRSPTAPGSCGGARAAARRRGARAARRAQPQNAMAAAAAAWRAGSSPDAVRSRRCARSPGSPHRLEEVATGRRRPVRQRLEGHQRGRRRCVALEALRRRLHADPRRQPQGRGLRAAARARGRALPPRYLIGEAAERSERDLAGRAAAPLRRPRARRGAAARRRAARRGGAALARRARATTSSGTTRSAGTRVQGDLLRGTIRHPASKAGPDACAVPPASDRWSTTILLHGHAVPARVRRGDGLPRARRAYAAERRRRPDDLPEALRGLGGDRAWWSCT